MIQSVVARASSTSSTRRVRFNHSILSLPVTTVRGTNHRRRRLLRNNGPYHLKSAVNIALNNTQLITVLLTEPIAIRLTAVLLGRPTELTISQSGQPTELTIIQLIELAAIQLTELSTIQSGWPTALTVIQLTDLATIQLTKLTAI
jgi:hypothetical protein